MFLGLLAGLDATDGCLTDSLRTGLVFLSMMSIYTMMMQPYVTDMGVLHVHIQDQAEMLVCKIAGCNKSFKSSKTLRRHVLQKHSDNARLLVCNQPTVNGEMCRFETIHSGVLSYHRKHSLAHQRREDWHIACPFCQSKFARQHEMERHRRICKSRPAAARVPSPSNVSSVQSSVTGMSVSDQGLNQPLQMSNFVVPDRGHNQHLF